MRIRNLPYKELNEKEQEIVRAHHKTCLNDESFACKDIPEEQSVEGFWENHREADTGNGTYEGWK